MSNELVPDDAKNDEQVPIPYWDDPTKANGIKFDADRKTRFIARYAETGRMAHSAKDVGVHYTTVKNHIKSDPGFKSAFEEAKAWYRDHIQQAVHMHAVEGVLEPIIGGQWKDQVVAEKRVYDTRLLALEAKRVNPEYRENGQDINVNVSAGVLVVPPKMTVDEWEASTKKAIDSG